VKPFIPWLERKEWDPRENNPDLERTAENQILVWCNTCDTPHVAMYDYDEWCHIEWCKNDGPLSGEPIDFDWWYPLFEKPYRKVEK
jgi:hypothetical protein